MSHDFRLSWIDGGNSSHSMFFASARDDIPNPLGDLPDPLAIGPSTLCCMSERETFQTLGSVVRRIASRLTALHNAKIEKAGNSPPPRRPTRTPPHGARVDELPASEIASPRDTAAGLTDPFTRMIAPHAQGPAAVHGDLASRPASLPTSTKSSGDRLSSSATRTASRAGAGVPSTVSSVLKR